MEGRRIFGSQEPNIQIDQVTTKNLWECLDRVFTKQRNITFDRYTFLTRKQLKGELVEKIYGFLRELSHNCDLGSHEESIIRDVFNANMQNGKIQRKLLKETRTAKKALEISMNIEVGIQNQLKIYGISAQSTTNKITSATVNNVQGSWNRTRRLIISSSQQSVQIVAMEGHNHIDKTAPPGERSVKTAVLLTILQRSVENQNLNINRSQESITSTIPFLNRPQWVCLQPRWNKSIT